MRTGWTFLAWAAACLIAMGSVQLNAQVMISELVADNDGHLLDEDGDASDWLELYNEGAGTVSLLDWALTDDPADPGQWRFPDVTIDPGEFLVVFASGKDRAEPDGELHASFRLSRPGEFLALLRPGGSPASIYSPEFPRQREGASYGLPMQVLVQELIPAGATARYYITTSGLGNDLPDDWKERDFDDADWPEGTSGFGFDRKDPPTFAGFINTDVGDEMFSRRSSFFLRFAFDVEDNAAIPALRIRVQYESGFVAHINGVEVARVNARSSVSPSSTAASRRPHELAVELEDVSLLGAQELLQPGRNILAVQLMNDSRQSPDLLFAPVLESVMVTGVDARTPAYFESPTPGSANAGVGRSALAEPPVFTTPSTFFTGSFSVALTTGAGASETRYTLDGTEPKAQSTLYTGPFTIEKTTTVRARSLGLDRVPSPITEGRFVALGEDLADFTSDLPLFFISAGRPIGTTATTPMMLQVVDVDASGRSSALGEPHFLDKGVIKFRGSSTEGRPKRAYAFEIQDDDGDDKRVEILGFPEDSDFILYAPYNFDRALMRNAFIYEVSNQAGRYAVRTKFCEVFVKTGSDPITRNNYVGVYSFMEKIKRGPERVDVEELAPSVDSEPEISGGYILKIDRADPGDVGLRAGGQTVRHVYPKEEDITPAQSEWLKQYFDDFNAALRGPDAADPDLGYAAYIDVGAWIDHHLLNEFTKNPDGYVLSAYMFKPRGEKLAAGPIWDFDRTMGPDDDDRARSPVGWSGQRLSTWYRGLLDDPGFVERYTARWRELRGGAMTVENLHAIIDRMADEIREAQVRNFERWTAVRSAGGWESEVDHLKDWVASRLLWMDTELSVPPSIVESGGQVEPGFQVTILAGEGEAYYTLTGADPRGEGNAPHPDAILFQGEPITVLTSTRIRVRGRAGFFWTGENQEDFVIGPPPLAITEIMYNPRGPEAGSPITTNRFEFLEIQNVSDSAIDIAALNLAPRPTFPFAEGSREMLGPGEYMVIVQSLEHFASRYPDIGMQVVGKFSGNLTNGAQTIGVDGLVGTVPVTFTLRYDDDWYPATDGGGLSLVLNDPHSDPATWNEPGAWRPSAEVHGSPGEADPAAGFQRRGDVTQDGQVNLADAVALVRSLHSATPLPCETLQANTQLRDINGDASANIADAFQLLFYLFNDGALPLGLAPDCTPIVGCPEACGR